MVAQTDNLGISTPPTASPSGTVSPFITAALSRGLADRATAVLEAQGDRYRSAMLPILRAQSRTKKSVSRMVAGLTTLGERTRLIQVIGKTPNHRLALISQFVPACQKLGTSRDLVIVSFNHHQYVVSVRGVIPGPDWGIALVAAEHAIERLFLRLNTLDVGAVFEELHDAMLLALPISIVGRALGLRQLALPTSCGAFLCDLPLSGDALVAKTWISDGALGGRWRPIVGTVRELIEDAGGESGLATYLALGLNGPLAEQAHPIVSGLAGRLARFSWLHDEYSPREDPVGDFWVRAREAAAAA